MTYHRLTTTIPTWRALRLVVALIGLALAPLAWAQGIVTSGLTGTIRDTGGKPVAGASVTATHVPTGTTYTATSSDTGRYNFRGLIAGGPYTVAVSGASIKPVERTELSTQLGADTEVNFSVAAGTGDIVALEKFMVKGETNELDSSATGAGSLLNSARLAAKPTTQRSFADVISASPFVSLRSMSSANDREEAHITALGQNNRYNSILIDGARINDQFGLNGTGLASFFNPLSIDTIDQLSVQVSPYDARESGFTGASINAVTKSGTNTFHGSAYYLLSKDHLLGLRGQGPDVAPGPTQGTVPKLKRTTWGATLGGPIIQNKLFFFLNYEKFERITAPAQAGFYPTAATVAAIDTRLSAINSASGKSSPWGTLGGNATNQAEDKKKLAKLDWNIVPGQRLSVRYSETEGEVPQFGSYASTTFTGVTLSGGATTAYTSNFYSQTRKEKTLASSLFSQWTPNFKTEVRFNTIQQDQLTPTVATLPEIHIFGLPGNDRSGTAVTNGAIIVGTDQFRHGNQIFVDTKSYSASGDYFLGNLTFSGGFDREENDYYNLFRAGSYGVFDYANLAAFQADTITSFTRAFYVQGTPQADVSKSAVTGLFANLKWSVTPRLSVLFGLRYDMVESGSRPPFNQLFLDRFGYRNDGTVDGTSTVSPRVSFNWTPTEDRVTQVRGGVGHFLGRAPWVFFSNSYSNPGIGRFNITTPPTGLVNYMQSTFDPNNPIGSAATIPAGGRYEINLADDKLKLPSVWRGNLAIDRKLPLFDSVLSLEFIQTYNDKTLFITNDNIRPTTVGADGRQRFAGNPSTIANTRFAEFINVYHVSQRNTGESRYITLMWDRPLKNQWAHNFSYTRGRSTEGQAFGQTTASGTWQRNPVFNQGAVEEAHSDFEIRDRFQLTLTREFEFKKKWKTLASLYYEGRSGNPYSYVYASDLNGDSRADNDLVAVPTGPTDARFDFSGMTATSQAAYFDYINSHGLSKYAGGYAPKNAFQQPWVNRLDIKISQTIPVAGPVKLELFADFINFGSFLSKKLFNYYEEPVLISNDVFRRLSLGTAAYSATGRIQPQANFSPAVANTNFVLENVQSRWRMQVGAKLSF
jgi:hypothetical protein